MEPTVIVHVTSAERTRTGDPAAVVSDAAAPGVSRPRLELLTKAGCHLCDDARSVVREVANSLGLTWQELSIDDQAELSARYAEEIPVVLVDGIPRDFWHIDPVRLRGILSHAMDAL